MNASFQSFTSPYTIIITGASSGIGAALAEYYAAPGIYLGLTARRQEQLEAVAETCRAKGAEVEVKACDVTDYETLSQWMQGFNQKRPVDLVIANAGISAGSGTSSEPEELSQIDRIFNVNFHAAIHSAHVLLPNMRQRGGGQIALMSSIAGFRGWGGAAAYCSSKAALRVYGESLRMMMAMHNIGISIICPGFVISPMTDRNEFPMPFKVETDKAAKIIAKKLAKNKKYIVFPWQMKFISKFWTILPEKVEQRLFSRYGGKN